MRARNGGRAPGIQPSAVGVRNWRLPHIEIFAVESASATSENTFGARGNRGPTVAQGGGGGGQGQRHLGIRPQPGCCHDAPVRQLH